MTAFSPVPAGTFEVHRGRGAFNAAFFSVMGPYIEWNIRARKQRLFADLPQTVVELGSGVGANLRHLTPGTTLVAVEPNVPMHRGLRAAAARHGVDLDLRQTVAEHTGLPDRSVDCVISSLVLCTVADPAAGLAEVRRITDRVAEFAAAQRIPMAQPLGPHRLVAQTLLDRYDDVVAARHAA